MRDMARRIDNAMRSLNKRQMQRKNSRSPNAGCTRDACDGENVIAFRSSRRCDERARYTFATGRQDRFHRWGFMQDPYRDCLARAVDSLHRSPRIATPAASIHPIATSRRQDRRFNARVW